MQKNLPRPLSTIWACRGLFRQIHGKRDWSCFHIDYYLVMLLLRVLLLEFYYRRSFFVRKHRIMLKSVDIRKILKKKKISEKKKWWPKITIWRPKCWDLSPVGSFNKKVNFKPCKLKNMFNFLDTLVETFPTRTKDTERIRISQKKKIKKKQKESNQLKLFTSE